MRADRGPSALGRTTTRSRQQQRRRLHRIHGDRCSRKSSSTSVCAVSAKHDYVLMQPQPLVRVGMGPGEEGSSMDLSSGSTRKTTMDEQVEGSRLVGGLDVSADIGVP